MSELLPNLRHLRAFREVARCHSVSGASERVFLSQPAITQAIAKLERELGTPLFERRNDGMFVSEAGALYLARAERALEHVELGLREAVRIGRGRGVRPSDGVVPQLTTTQLRALVAVAGARNFSLAARAVGISQPSLHRAARDLERLLDFPLFERGVHGIVLTRAAALLAQQAKLAFAELVQGVDEVRALQGVEVGRIVVGSMPLARTYLLPQALNVFAGQHPGVAVRVVDGPYADLLHGLRHGDIDLLIGALRTPAPAEDVVQQPLFDDPLAVVARAGHPLTSRRRVEPRELARWPWVIAPPGTPTRECFDALLARAGGAPRGLIESSSLVLMRGLLLGSDRLTLVSAHQVREELRLGLLAVVPFTGAGAARPIGLTLRSGWRPTPLQQRFLDGLVTVAERLADVAA